MNSYAVRRYLAGIRVRFRGRNRVRRQLAWQGLWVQRLCKVGFEEANEADVVKIDVVIPTVPKDSVLLAEVVAGVRHHLAHPVNKIYIIAPPINAAMRFCEMHDCVFVDERRLLGYGPEAVPYVALGQDRSGWLFQQLLKLAAAELVECVNYLVIDSDTVLIRRHRFMEEGRFVFLAGEEWHQPYSDAYRQMFGYAGPETLSYTAHMMIFNREFLRQMKTELEQRHGVPWDRVFRRCARSDEVSCVSEYDTYANWVLRNHADVFRQRAFYNASLPRNLLAPLDELRARYGAKWKSVSFHSYVN